MAGGQAEGKLAKGVIARLVSTFVKDAERLEARAAARQAAREAERVAAKDAGRTGEQLAKDYAERFYKAHPGTEGNVVVHHSIEQQIERRYPGMFTQEEIHDLASLRGIPNELNNSLHLSNIRRLWNGFYKEFPDATANQVRAFRDMVDEQFGHLFNPPL